MLLRAMSKDREGSRLAFKKIMRLKRMRSLFSCRNRIRISIVLL